MAGEFLYFAIYVVQQLGVMLGVGAQTVLLCTHLVAVHHGEVESRHINYAHAARFALGVGILLMVISGLVAVAVHSFSGELEVLLAPAFLFKWFLIACLIIFLLIQPKVASWSGTFFAFSGGSWFALFLVHSLGPVTSWSTLWVLYVLWSIFFALVWACFVAVMKWNTLKPEGVPIAVMVAPRVIIKEVPKVVIVPPPVVVAAPPPIPKPVPPPPPPPVVVVPLPAPVAPKPIVITVQPSVPTVSLWKRIYVWIVGSKPQPVATLPPPPAPIVIAPAPSPAPQPVVVATPPPPPAPKVIITPPPAPLPVVVPLSLSVPKTVAPVATVPPVAKPAAPTKTTPAATPHPSMLQEVIDHFLVPALRIMPQRVEDVGKQNRPPVVKLSDE